ncbi:MAG: HlyD family efflux transporter periplasmic adaptor subunit [Pseudomonadota bacterium]
MTDVRAHSEYFHTLNEINVPKASRTVAYFLVLFALMLGAFLYFVPWVQTTSGPGRVTALNPNDRQQEINALVSGRIAEWFVQDGMAVEAGAPIVTIVDNDPLALQRLQAARDQVQAKLAAAESAQRIAEIDERRTQDLFTQGLESSRNAEQARSLVESRRAAVAEASAELSRIEIEISRLAAQTVTAPRDGVILSVNAGDVATFISAGQPVATFVPSNVTRAVELFVNGRDVALVQPGNVARLQFEGWPAVQFSGWPSQAIGTFGGVVLAVDASAQPNGLFRVLIGEDPNADETHAWPEDRFVRFGANVRGWIQLETVTVGYEIWRLLNNFPPDFAINPGPNQ